MAAINSITSLTLDLPPSCIAFCPRRPQLFVVGTYHLHRKEQEGDLSAGDLNKAQNTAADTLPDHAAGHDDATIEEEGPQKRTGSLILFHLDDDNNITRLSTTSTDFAILDIQWSPHPERLGGDVLAVAASTGLLAFYRLNACGSSESPSGSHVKADNKLVLACEKRIADPSTLVLSLTWHPSRAETLGVTLSDGRVCFCDSTSADGNTIPWTEDSSVETSDIHYHSLEAWTLAFNHHRPHQLLSGGDDIVLQCSHTDIDNNQPPCLLYQDRRLHQAGITAILPLTDTLVVTGSYDDHIRLLSLPSAGRKQCLAELNLGGGVWRLKVLQSPQSDLDGDDSAPASPSRSSVLLLASCMHAGSRIVKLIREEGGDDWKFEVLARFEEHRSMNYGSDVQPGGAEEGARRKKRIVSTSFYDKLLCLWEFEG